MNRQKLLSDALQIGDVDVEMIKSTFYFHDVKFNNE